MSITEPTTTLTDYAIAIESIVFAGVLLRAAVAQKQVSKGAWAIAFGCVAVAAVAGGTYHGFRTGIDRPTVIALWRIVIYALSVASLCMLVGTIISSLPRYWQRWWLLAVGIKSVIYWHWVGTARFFSYAVIDYFSAMLIVLLLQIRAMSYQENPTASRWIVAGILVSAIAVAVQAARISLAEHFNHNDLYHVIQMVALYLLFRGTCLLKDR